MVYVVCILMCTHTHRHRQAHARIEFPLPLTLRVLARAIHHIHTYTRVRRGAAQDPQRDLITKKKELKKSSRLISSPRKNGEGRGGQDSRHMCAYEARHERAGEGKERRSAGSKGNGRVCCLWRSVGEKGKGVG